MECFARYFLSPSYNFFLVLHMIFILMAFGPVFIYSTSLHVGKSANAFLISSQYLTECFFAIVICLPMGFDMVYESIFSSVSPSSQLNKAGFSLFCLLLSFSVPNIIQYNEISNVLFNGASSSTIVGLYQCSAGLRNFSSLVYALEIISVRTSKVIINGFSPWMMTTMILTYGTGELLLLYQIHLVVNAHLSNILGICGIVLLVSSFFQFLYLVICWMQSMIRSYSSDWKSIAADDATITVSLSGILFFSIATVVVTYTIDCSNPHTMSNKCISANSYIQIMYAVIMVALPGRIVRLRGSQLKRSLDARSKFVRYISHQIRTPLNTVAIGGSFLEKAVYNLSLRFGRNRLVNMLDTIKDIRDSSETATEIMDELREFTNMQGGKLTVNLEVTDPIQFIAMAARPFKLNAKDKGIAFQMDFVGMDAGWAKAYKVRIGEYATLDLFRLIMTLEQMCVNMRQHN